MPKPRNLFAAGLTGWHVSDRYDFEDKGDVSFDSNILKLGRGDPATGISYRGAPPSRNYKLSWEARRTDGSDFFCGLTFPIRDSYATLIVGGWGGGVVGVSNIDGLSAVENESTDYREFKSNQWYSCELDLTEESVSFKIDGKFSFDIDHEDHQYAVWWEQEQMTPLGFATWHTAAELRNVMLLEY